MEHTYIDVATNWWEEILFSRSMEKFDVGEEVGLRTRNVGQRLSVKPTEKSVLMFKNMLVRAIKIYESYGETLVLESNYKPVGVLAQVVEASNVTISSVPWKTTMIITPESVQVSMGHEKEFETLFGPKE